MLAMSVASRRSRSRLATYCPSRGGNSMDAANVDLKAFTQDFYHRVCAGHLDAVLDTLEYLRHETTVWFEITTLLIPGLNDSDKEVDAETGWIAEHLGPDVPLHFTAFHPDYKMRDIPPTPPATLSRARRIALANGLHFVYTGNVHDPEGGTTYCPGCSATVVVRDWYDLKRYELTDHGRCRSCGTAVPGVYDGAAGRLGRPSAAGEPLGRPPMKRAGDRVRPPGLRWQLLPRRTGSVSQDGGSTAGGGTAAAGR
jgi:AmmeMemoRadiSam system radical SAM enzyme